MAVLFALSAIVIIVALLSTLISAVLMKLATISTRSSPNTARLPTNTFTGSGNSMPTMSTTQARLAD
jgi:hypothetical protein